MIYNLPNILTLSRIGVIPPIIGLLYWDNPLAGWIACGVFALAGLTDFFDGYFARSRRQSSRVGRMLDPIADKLLVTSVLLMLVAFDRAPAIAALIILCRELMVSGLREYLAEVSVGMPVSRLAKWKTGIQMGAIGFLLVGEAGPTFGAPFLTTVLIGEILLWIAAALTLFTGFRYLRAGLVHMKRPLPRGRQRRARAALGAARSTGPAA